MDIKSCIQSNVCLNDVQQTGSGKTFTITGGAERYMDRGIIPRSLSYIFETFQKVLFIQSSYLCYCFLHSVSWHALCGHG